jgi:hypothetical protein
MPYASNGQISTDPFEGAIEITQEQYDAALAGMLDGRTVTVDGGFAVIDVPVPEPEIEPAPQPTPQPDSLTFPQLLIGLVQRKWITEAEGEAWLSGTVPASIAASIAALPKAQRFAAKVKAAHPTTILRDDPMLSGLGKSADQLDTFFSVYSQT